MVSFLKRLLTINHNKPLSNEVQLRFLKQLARLLRNGYSIIDALEIMKWDKQLIMIAEQMIERLKQGAPIYKAFDDVKFHETITGYIYFVKDNGDILSSIEKCAEMFESRLKYMKKFQDIVRYPLILLFIFSILLYFINEWVLPSFLDIFHSSPEATSIIAYSMIIIEILFISTIVCGLLFLILFFIWHVNNRKIPIELKVKVYSVIPIYRHFLKLQTSFQFATHLSSQLKTGMSFKAIFQNMSQQNKLPIIAYYTSLMTLELSNGYPLTNLLSRLVFLEKQITLIFQKNKDKYELEKDLAAYADFLMEELHRKTMKAITFIQPTFFIIVAFFIIFIYVTLMWPMMQMIRTI